MSNFIELLDDVVADGEITYREIYDIAKWINDNPVGRKEWPASEFVKLLQRVFEDGKISKQEARVVADVIQNVRRRWYRENAVEQEPARELTIVEMMATFDFSTPKLPLFNESTKVDSQDQDGVEYRVDHNGPTCTCPDFAARRSQFEIGHLNRCCKHLLKSFAQFEPAEGWGQWLDAFFHCGWKPHPKHKWTIVRIGTQNALVSSAINGWGNVYFDDQKFGYSIDELRWSYGIEPPNRNALSTAIHEMSRS